MGNNGMYYYSVLFTYLLTSVFYYFMLPYVSIDKLVIQHNKSIIVKKSPIYFFFIHIIQCETLILNVNYL